MSNKFWKTSFPLASLILAGGLTIASCTTGTTDTATAPAGTSIVRQVADTTSTSKGTTSQTISNTAKAAEEFLNTLSDEQSVTTTTTKPNPPPGPTFPSPSWNAPG